jgi:hypothetical protein
MKAKIEYKGYVYNVELIDGKPLAVAPKSYKYIGVFGHNLGYDGLGDLYQTKSGDFMYAIYRDGCFYPYYGRLIFGPIIDTVLGDKKWFVLAGKEETEHSGLTKADAIKMATKLRDKNEQFYIGMNKYVCGELKYTFCNLDNLIEQK